ASAAASSDRRVTVVGGTGIGAPQLGYGGHFARLCKAGLNFPVRAFHVPPLSDHDHSVHPKEIREKHLDPDRKERLA
ncbi:MAG: hypothetical protein ACRDT6_25215, partial [Micromonosporaceae bacterium]